MIRPEPLSFGDIADTTKPLAVLVHGFPDTPHTWRHLGPDLATRGYRVVVAPWLPGYDAAVGKPISVGTYVRHLLDVREQHRGDERAVLIGHRAFPASGTTGGDRRKDRRLARGLTVDHPRETSP